MATVYTYYTNGQATLGTDKQLVLVFALVNKLEGAPAGCMDSKGRKMDVIYANKAVDRDSRHDCDDTMSG